MTLGPDVALGKTLSENTKLYHQVSHNAKICTLNGIMYETHNIDKKYNLYRINNLIPDNCENLSIALTGLKVPSAMSVLPCKNFISCLYNSKTSPFPCSLTKSDRSIS